MRSWKPRTNFSQVFLFTISTFLYPYSRFVYEGLAEYIVGNNLIVVNFGFAIVNKLITITICWVYAIFIAPAGLVYPIYLKFGITLLMNSSKRGTVNAISPCTGLEIIPFLISFARTGPKLHDVLRRKKRK